MTALLLALLAFVAPPTQASELELAAQYAASIGAQFEINNNVGIRVSIHQFGIPKTGATMRFAYVGPVISVTPDFWVSPQVGVMSGWMADGTDALLGSVWFGASHGSFSLFGEGDIYVATGNPTDVYSYLSADWNHEAVNLGLQAEMVGVDPVFGPHLGGTKGALHVEGLIFLNPNFDTLALRLSTTVSF
ncbi:MAG: hypothetical protein V1716_02780 [Candidatus Uhrbacteria bacterium]